MEKAGSSGAPVGVLGVGVDRWDTRSARRLVRSAFSPCVEESHKVLQATSSVSMVWEDSKKKAVWSLFLDDLMHSGLVFFARGTPRKKYFYKLELPSEHKWMQCGNSWL